MTWYYIVKDWLMRHVLGTLTLSPLSHRPCFLERDWQRQSILVLLFSIWFNFFRRDCGLCTSCRPLILLALFLLVILEFNDDETTWEEEEEEEVGVVIRAEDRIVIIFVYYSFLFFRKWILSQESYNNRYSEITLLSKLMTKTNTLASPSLSLFSLAAFASLSILLLADNRSTSHPSSSSQK